MRINDIHLKLREMKHGGLLDSFPEKPDESPGHERSIKAVYDQVMEINKEEAYPAIMTHHVSSLSRLKRAGAVLRKFQERIEHK